MVLTHTLFYLQAVTLPPVKDGAWVDADAALPHHFGQIAIAEAVLAVSADAQQDDRDRKATALEQGRQDDSPTDCGPLNTKVNATVPDAAQSNV